MLEYQDGGNADAFKVHRRAGSSSMGQANSSASLAAIADGPVIDAASPEAESYAYIETVLEALAVLGRLGGALERVTQRVSSEIHTLIEATLDEVEERVEQRRSEAQDEPFAMRLSNSLDVGGPPQHAAILRDLFWTLYSKLAAVLEGHRIVYEVARWISSVSMPMVELSQRRDFRDSTIKGSASLNIPVLEVYKPLQNAVRTLLRSYLTDDRRSGMDSRPLMTVNEVLRDGRIARDRQKVRAPLTMLTTVAIQV
jgi:exocyst complex component 4